MDHNAIVYTDILVSSLMHISELNAQVNEYLYTIGKNNQKLSDIEQKARAEMIFDFAHCMKINVKYNEARNYALGMNKAPETIRERMLVNIRNVIDYVESSYHNETFGWQVLSHCNKLILDGVLDTWDTGKLINQHDAVDGSRNFAINKLIIYEPDVSAYITYLGDYYNSSTYPSLLKVAVMFVELINTDIFKYGNDPAMLGVLLHLFRRLGFPACINYYKCIDAIIKDDITVLEFPKIGVLLELFFHELEKEYMEVKQRLIPIIDEGRIVPEKYIDLNLRQIKGLAYIKEKGKISREIYARLNNISHITSYRDLNNLLQKGYVRVEGIGKGTKYII